MNVTLGKPFSSLSLSLVKWEGWTNGGFPQWDGYSDGWVPYGWDWVINMNTALNHTEAQREKGITSELSFKLSASPQEKVASPKLVCLEHLSYVLRPPFIIIREEDSGSHPSTGNGIQLKLITWFLSFVLIFTVTHLWQVKIVFPLQNWFFKASLSDKRR